MILTTGRHDGTIRVWDIRCKERRWDSQSVTPISTVVGAHKEWDTGQPGQLYRVIGPCRKTITSVTYDRYSASDIISGGSFNGCVP